MTAFALSIITPAGKFFDGSVESITAPGEEGYFGVLKDHAPFVSTLKSGILKVTENNQQKQYKIGSGILEVRDKRGVLILVDSIEHG